MTTDVILANGSDPLNLPPLGKCVCFWQLVGRVHLQTGRQSSGRDDQRGAFEVPEGDAAGKQPPPRSRRGAPVLPAERRRDPTMCVCVRQAEEPEKTREGKGDTQVRDGNKQQAPP